MRNTTRRGRSCSNGCARVSRIVFCRSTAALSIPSRSAGRLRCAARGRCAASAASGSTGDDCSTGVPGLYAAGDAASRERLTGAISGGGGPNSSWAIASGNWAGRAAASYARARAGRHATAPTVPLGARRVAAERRHRDKMSRPPNWCRSCAKKCCRSTATISVRAVGLEASLDTVGCELAALSWHLRGEGAAAVRAREAAALIATSRWAYRSALARVESRGMHRRRDRPATDPAFACLFEASGLDSVRIARQPVPWGAAA